MLQFKYHETELLAMELLISNRAMVRTQIGQSEKQRNLFELENLFKTHLINKSINF